MKYIDLDYICIDSYSKFVCFFLKNQGVRSGKGAPRSLAFQGTPTHTPFATHSLNTSETFHYAFHKKRGNGKMFH